MYVWYIIFYDVSLENVYILLKQIAKKYLYDIQILENKIKYTLCGLRVFCLMYMYNF